MNNTKLRDCTAASSAATFNGAYVIAVSSIAALGGLLFGYDWVVIGGAKPFYEPFFHLTQPGLQGWAMSCALIGCLLGAITSGKLSDRYGRKRFLMLAALVFIVSSVGTALADQFAIFVSWRVLGGFAIGLASSLSPMYIAEIAPAHRRGQLVSLNQLTIVIGILLAQIADWWIARPVPANATVDQILHSWNGQMGWRWMFGVTAIPAALFFTATFALPESPRWLAQQGFRERARRVLSRIGGELYADSTLEDVQFAAESKVSKLGLQTMLEPKMRKVLTLGILLAVLQQWCGITILFNYAEEIFSAAGYRVSDILFNIVVTGTVNLAFTFVALFTVDRFGRRKLVLIGSAGLTTIYIVLGVLYRLRGHGFYMLLLVVAAIGCYAMSLAPVTWVLISEIFPTRVRGSAMSLSVTALWIASFLITYSFPLLNHALGVAGAFWLFAAVCAAGFLYLRANLRETKGRSLEEIEANWL
jgi:MFS transporter, SP family, arabinose:H+ symporter